MRTLTILTFVALTIFACSKKKTDDSDAKEEEGTGNLSISEMKDIPNITAPVEEYKASDSSDAADEARSFDSLQVELKLSEATTGVKLGRTVSELNSAFNAASGSKAFCNVVNKSMKFVFEAGGPDFFLCVLKDMAAKKTDIYDGNYKVFDMTGEMDGQEVHYQAKFKIVRNEKQISEFEMFSCSNESGGGELAASELSQDRYFKQTIKADSLTLYSKMKGPQGSISVLEMSSPLNTDGKFVGIKQIDYKDTFAEDGNYTNAVIKQSANNIEYLGFQGSEKILAFYEIVDHNEADTDEYAITELAIGNGAAYIENPDNVNDATPVLQGWSGDTLTVNGSEDRLAKVQDRSDELPEPNTKSNSTFKGDEKYDCSDKATHEAELDMDAVEACMARYEIDQDGEGFCSDLSY